jgi:glycosidase
MTVAGQADDPDSLLSHYRRLIRLRNRHASLRSGDFALVSTDNDAVFAFRRRIEGETSLVVANLGDEPVAQYALGPGAGEGANGAPEELLSGYSAAAPPRGDDEYRPLPELAPKAAYVFVWAQPASGQGD